MTGTERGITHSSGCPAIPNGGSASGCCLCLPAGLKSPQPRAATPVEAPSFNTPYRREVNQRPAEIRHWAVDTGHPMAEVLVRSCLRPEVVRDYMASLRTEVAS